MAADLSFGKPLGHIEGSAVETFAREIIADWKRMEPEEVAKWRRAKRSHEQRLIRNGWTREQHLQHTCSIPMYVALMMGRKLGDPNWIAHDHKALEALLRVMPEAKVSTGRSMKLDADR
jgi:hypothetical protein